jgi:hypothetical protein
MVASDKRNSLSSKARTNFCISYDSAQLMLSFILAIPKPNVCA